MTAARRGTSAELVLGTCLTASLSAVAFVAGGGTDVGPNAGVQIGLLLAAAAVLIWTIMARPPGRHWGLWPLALFGALCALTYSSIAWSVAPDSSWLEANRTLSYLAAFGSMIALARLQPARWRAVVVAVGLTCAAISAWALVVKVFPDTLDPRDPLGRLNVPLGYWNAIGITAAMGLPPCLWMGAARPSSRWLRVLAAPAVALLISALLMSASRGALAIAIVGLAVWFAVVPLRLRALATLALGGAAAAAVCAWALPNGSLSGDYVTLHARIAAGHSFGLVLSLAIVATLTASAPAVWLMERVRLAPRIRRQVGAALVIAASLLPVAGVIALAESSRGLTGSVSHAWRTLTNPNGGVGDQPSRLLNLSNSRTRYWSEGLTVGEHHLLAGAGALGFAVAHQRYAKSQFPVDHAHDYLIETFADLGLIGVATSLALLLAWVVTAGRALGLERAPGQRAGQRGRRHWGLRGVSAGASATAHTQERSGLLTLATVVLMFGLHSLIDWTWFIPGTAVLALACAGWLAGRGPLPASRQAGTRPRPSPALGMAIVAVLAVLIAAIWFVYQPERSAAYDSAAASALAAGQTGDALTDTRRAKETDPLALEPLYLLSAVYVARGDLSQARSELLDAVSLEPQNPSPWQTLASFELTHGQPELALRALARAKVLYPGSLETAELMAEAHGELHP